MTPKQTIEISEMKQMRLLRARRIGWSDHWLALALKPLLLGGDELLTRRVFFVMQTLQIIVSKG
jgi:hypothetical protein